MSKNNLKIKKVSGKYVSKGPSSKGQQGGETYVTDTVRTENVETGGFRGSMTSGSATPYIFRGGRSVRSPKGETGRQVTAQNSSNLIFKG